MPPTSCRSRRLPPRPASQRNIWSPTALTSPRSIGGAGTWYFASLPLKEAADYILLLKNAPASPPNAPQSTPPASHHIQHNQKPKSTQETQPQTEAAPVTQQP